MVVMQLVKGRGLFPPGSVEKNTPGGSHLVPERFPTSKQTTFMDKLDLKSCWRCFQSSSDTFILDQLTKVLLSFMEPRHKNKKSPVSGQMKPG